MPVQIALLGFELSEQTLLDGIAFGLGYGLLGVGFVLLYRNSRVINLAYAEVGAFASAVFLVLKLTYSWAYVPAVVVALLIGAAVGALTELIVVRRLIKAPRVVIFVATGGVAQLLLLAQILLPSLPAGSRIFPAPVEWRGSLGDGVIRGAHLFVFVVAPVVVAILAIFLRRSIWGKAIRGAADNLDAARLAGIPAPILSTIVWAIGGVLATITQLVTRPLLGTGIVGGVSLDARTLVIALAAASVARLRSLPVAMVTGVLLGLLQRALLVNYPGTTGLFDLILGAIILVSILTWKDRGTADEGQEWTFVPVVKQVPAALRGRWYAERMGQLVFWAFAIAAALAPLVVTSSSRQFLYTRILLTAVVAVSVTILTGWAGQLSLGQFAFAGLAAFAGHRLAEAGLGFFPILVLATAIAVLAAVLVGLPALRVRGLLLAVVTLAFALIAENDLYARFLGDDPSGRIRRAGTQPIDLASQRTYYWFCLVVLLLVVVVAVRVRQRGTGRSLVAVRSNEPNAAAFAISPARQKLIAFALAGAIAGLAGVLFGANAPAGFGVTDNEYTVEASIAVVSIAVIGGLTSVAGAVVGALWVIGLPAFFPDSPAAPLLASGLGLLVVLMYFPGGLAQLGVAAKDALFRWLATRAEAEAADSDRPATGLSAGDDDPHAEPAAIRAATVHGAPDAPALETSAVSVRFDGPKVVSDVDLRIERGEVVGLIGSNGAGKSTLMNAIGGYVPSTGRVLLHGTDISSWAPARRSRQGLGRAFQSAGLFPELSVLETLQVALERQMRTSWIVTLTGWPTGRSHERQLDRTASELIDLVGLGRYAHHRVSELSTGTRRIVELACLVAHGGSVICLDEPTAGVAQAETEAFGPLVLDVRRQLDATMVIIEHDMPLIMSVSDRVYCMEAGVMIAEGDPESVRSDPLVVASYLGTDVRAIERSGPTT